MRATGPAVVKNLAEKQSARARAQRTCSSLD